MWRALLIVGICLVILLFASLNMHSTQINFPFSKGFEMRTVFLLTLCFVVGYGAAYFVGLAKDLKKRSSE